jgi:lipoprotein-releasing system permease protein
LSNPAPSRELKADHAWRLPTAIMVAGLLWVGLSVLGWALAKKGSPLQITATMNVLVGAAAAIAGLVTLLFTSATYRSYEWLLAWRYLRRSKSSWATLVVGLVLLLAAGGLFIASAAVAPEPIGGIQLQPTKLSRGLQIAGLVVLAGGALVFTFGLLLLPFSIFTSISVYGVYLGTTALVVVLSVMGGFEHDLRGKILGTRAHVVVTKPKAMFENYREIAKKVRAIPGVKAVAPYIESEVMITSQTNLSGVLLRGIDPKTITDVTDLRRYMKPPAGSGRLSSLLHPERLAKIPASSYRIGKPMVSPPLGKKTNASGGDSGQRGDGGHADHTTDGGVQKDALATDSGRKAGKNDKSGQNPTPSVAQGQAPDVPVDGASPKKVLKPARATPPASQPKTTLLPRKVEPRPVFPALIVGAELARNLRLYVGDDVNLVSPLGGMSPMGPIPKSRPFRIGGIFFSGMYEYDTKYAYVTMREAQRFLGLEDEITGLEIKVHDVAQAEQMAEQIAKVLGKGYVVKDWQKLNKNLFSALKLEKIVMFIVLTFIVLVASFSIVTNLIMMVLQKGREIGALKALGASHHSVLKTFIYAGVYIGVIGTLGGVIIGVSICTYLAQIGLPLDPEVYYISKLPVRMSPLDISLIAVAGMTMSLLATIYPALKAASLPPVDALRNEG